jgi:hypothetical protein
MSHRVTCVYHCCAQGGCGRHFASEEAWELHRKPNGDGTRHCVDPNEVEGKTPRTRLAPKDTDGICLLAGYEVHGVTVWQTEDARNKGRRFVA